MIPQNNLAGKFPVLFIAFAILAGVQFGFAENEDQDIWRNLKGADGRLDVEKIRQAAEQGDVRAQSILGLMYEKGSLVEKDRNLAVKWYRKAAEQGDASAQNSLGRMYDKSEFPWEWRDAVKWYRKAAEQGEPAAQHNLARMYYEGRGVPEDYQEAAEWYRKAAEQGEPAAQSSLGFMYARGEGVEKDHVKAYAWANLAAARGREMVVTPRVFGIEGEETSLKDWIREQMNSRQVTKAQKLSSELWDRIGSSAVDLARPRSASEAHPAGPAYTGDTETAAAILLRPEAVDGGRVYRYGSGVTNPVPIVQTTPSYTDAAIKAKVQGVVWLQAIIRKDGNVDSFKVIRGLGHGLDEQAIREIDTNWRFRPGMLNGSPVDVLAAIKVQFNLR